MSTATGIPQVPIGVPSSLASSRRTSSETATSTSTVPPASGSAATSSSAAGLAAARRNRAALRDFYGLKDTPQRQDASGRDGSDIHADSDEVKPSILDSEGFDANAHVKTMLASEGLEDILKTESKLVTEIRSLDGDRKALVYDNYSKLIMATETIRKMRAKMDPLAPTTSTLAPAIAHIAGTAERLTQEMKQKADASKVGVVTNDGDNDVMQKRNQQADTVKWVVSAPQRYRDMLGKGNAEAVEEDWTQVRELLTAWEKKDVAGAKDIRISCEQIVTA